MSTAPFPPTPASQVRAVLQALQAVLDLAADTETVTLPTRYLQTWREQLGGVLALLDAAVSRAAPRDLGWRWLLLLGAMMVALLLLRCFL